MNLHNTKALTEFKELHADLLDNIIPEISVRLGHRELNDLAKLIEEEARDIAALWSKHCADQPYWDFLDKRFGSGRKSRHEGLKLHVPGTPGDASAISHWNISFTEAGIAIRQKDKGAKAGGERFGIPQHILEGIKKYAESVKDPISDVGVTTDELNEYTALAALDFCYERLLFRPPKCALTQDRFRSLLNACNDKSFFQLLQIDPASIAARKPLSFAGATTLKKLAACAQPILAIDVGPVAGHVTNHHDLAALVCEWGGLLFYTVSLSNY